MERRKINLYLILTIFVLVLLVLMQSVKIDQEMKKWRRFTYEDWVYLYYICNKKPWPKESLVDKIYSTNNTDFREFILWK